MIKLSQEQLQNFQDCLSQEWLETNGLGSYAMGTSIGARTRRYHGYFAAAMHPPVDRMMLLSGLEDTLRVNGSKFALSSNIYGQNGEVVHPAGWQLLTEFRLDPWPIWTYEAGGVTLEKHVLMLHDFQGVVIRYKCLRAEHAITVAARPLIAWRDHHHLEQARVSFEPLCEWVNAELPFGSSVPDHQIGCLMRITVDQGMPMFFEYGDGQCWGGGDWYYDFYLPEEKARGLDCVEDLFSPGEVTWTLREDQTVSFVVSLEPLGHSVEKAVQAEAYRREALVMNIPEDKPVIRTLVAAADQFIVKRPGQGPEALSIIAGYPWFTDWGRDTMIAIPGLLLATGRYDEARRVLLTYAEHIKDGLLPNVFTDEGDGAAYNTMDATLWMFVVAKKYYDKTKDDTLFEQGFYKILQDILKAHMEGTQFGIRMDDDGLLIAGDETTQLTWMDAKVDDWVVTPRHGKAVEINALWYNAVRVMEYFARRCGHDEKDWARLGRAIKQNFTNVFWNEEDGCLYDCVHPDYCDASIRPNQVIALNLPYSPLTVDQMRSVLRVITEHLLTPYGLRTLSPQDSRYQGKYEGDVWARDGAYHQGTVWPWLLGSYLTAYLTLFNRSDEALEKVRELLMPLIGHLQEAGLGSISEIFDADPPHTPRGCPAQAWSVSEILRVLIEETSLF